MNLQLRTTNSGTSWCYDTDFGFWDQQKHDYKDKKLVDIMTSGKGLKDR